MSKRSPNSNIASRPARGLRPGWFCAPELVRVGIDDAPEFLRGVKALFVTDVHLRRWVSDERLAEFIEQLASAKADLLLLGGDYAESRRDCRRFFRALGRLRFPLGAFAVLGNNDSRMRDELPELAASAGVALLVNEARRVELPGGALVIGGCDEHKYGEPRTAGLFPGDGSYRVLLSHYPAPPECDCELMLSGHTHGGQLRPFGLSPYALGYERRFHLMAEEGLRKVGDTRLLVGRGIGVSKLPLRWNAPPELDLLEFIR